MGRGSSGPALLAGRGRGLSCSALHCCGLISVLCAVWVPQYKQGIKLLESVQRVAKMKCLEGKRCVRNAELHGSVGPGTEQAEGSTHDSPRLFTGIPSDLRYSMILRKEQG